MKYFVNTDKNGNVTGLFRVQQRDGQTLVDASDAKVVSYVDAKLARLSETPDIVDRVAKLEADMLAAKG